MQNRRKAERLDVHKSATISLLDQRSKVKCVIEDLSSTGARLRLPFPLVIPDNLTLSIPGDNLVLEVNVRWRSHLRCGLQFKQRIAHPLLTLHRMQRAAENVQFA